MRGTNTPIAIFLAVVAAAILLALVTSIPSSAMPPRTEANVAGNSQIITPTPTSEAEPAGASEAGSTDGILWMGLVIAAIIVLPLLASPAMWKKQP